jgi:hypothetical protein
MDSPQEKEETQEEIEDVETNWISVGKLFTRIIDRVIVNKKEEEEAMDRLQKALEEVS